MIRAGRKISARLAGLAALPAVIALVLQFAVPGFAHASATPATHAIEICTENGVQTLALDLPAAPAGHEDCAKCPVCVTPSIAVLPPSNADVLSVRLAAPRDPGGGALAAPPPARARLRPFGQGPPSLDA